MLEVSLGSSWPKDLPRMEAPSFLEPVGPEIPKNRETFLLPPSKKDIDAKKLSKTLWLEEVLFFQ